MGQPARRACVALISAAVAVPLAVLLAACGVPKAQPAPATSTSFAGLGPTTMESSAPISPEWVMRTGGEEGGLLSFVGQSAAPTLDAAKGRAERDLLAAISSYVSVDVESDMEDVSWHDRSGEGQKISSTTKTKTNAALSEIRPDGYYWERVAPSPLAVDAASYQYFLHASVPKAEISRVRLSKLATRKSASGLAVVAMVPFRAVGGSTTAEDLIARGLYEETARLLSRSPQLHLTEESVVRSAIGDAQREKDRADRVKGALMPDWLISATVTSYGARLRITAAIEDGAEKTQSIVLIRPASALPRLARELAQAIVAKLGASLHRGGVQPKLVAPKNEDLAFRAYSEAGIKFQSGALDEALARIKKAIELSPSHAPSYMRLGRILERMGRFAKIPPTPQQPYNQEWLQLCTSDAQQAQQRAMTALNARGARLAQSANAPSWWEPDMPFVDAVLDEAVEAMEVKAPKAYAPAGVQVFSFDSAPPWVSGKKEEEPELDESPVATAPASVAAKTAVQAYARAERLFTEQHDDRGSIEATLGLADLSARVDRYDHALWFYRQIQVWAERERDPHFESLAHYGRAIIYRKKSLLEPARQELLLALRARAKLGEKPYVLEIYNELGSVALSLSEYDAAEALYKNALRIADELSSDYLQSVLANNVGAVEWARGHTTAAAERFQRAADKLTDLRESEGRVTASLNLAASLGLRGELDPATLLYEETGRLVEQTQQEGRIAELALHRGTFDINRGKQIPGYDALATSYLLYQRIGRRTESLRARDAIYAAEYYQKGRDYAATLACMKGRYWGVDAAVFEPQDVVDDKIAPLPSPLATANVPARELILALDAAAVLALDPTPTQYDRAVVFAPEQTTPPAEADPRAAIRLQREQEEQRRRMIEQQQRMQLQYEQSDRVRPTEREELELDEEAPTVAPREPTTAPAQRDEAGTDVVEALGTSLSGAEDTSSAQEPARQTVQVAKTVDYERILGAFTIEADVLILLDPATVEKYATKRLIPSARRALEAIETKLLQRGATRHYAVAALDDGALAWAAGDAEDAYQSLMNAERAFNESGDARGLAHVHTWLAHMFEASGATDIAAEHRWLAEQLFARVTSK